MRVNIEHHETQSGFLRKTTYHDVHVKVDFNEEELQVIKDNKLGDTVVLERTPQAGIKDNTDGLEHIFHLRIRNLLEKKPDIYACHTPLDAKKYEKDVTEGLKSLKAYIEENKGIEEKSTTFEL